MPSCLHVCMSVYVGVQVKITSVGRRDSALGFRLPGFLCIVSALGFRL